MVCWFILEQLRAAVDRAYRVEEGERCLRES